jgi:hypothetical protein
MTTDSIHTIKQVPGFRLARQGKERFAQRWSAGSWLRKGCPTFQATDDNAAIVEFEKWLEGRKASKPSTEAEVKPKQVEVRTYETEEAFQQDVIDLLHLNGWEVSHTRMSKGSNPGDPDLECRRERLFWAELKLDGKQPTAEQHQRLEWLQAHGFEAYLWRPADWEEIEATITRRAK